MSASCASQALRATRTGAALRMGCILELGNHVILLLHRQRQLLRGYSRAETHACHSSCRVGTTHTLSTIAPATFSGQCVAVPKTAERGSERKALPKDRGRGGDGAGPKPCRVKERALVCHEIDAKVAVFDAILRPELALEERCTFLGWVYWLARKPNGA